MKVKGIGVAGAGTMGAGISLIAAVGGYETFMWDPDPAALNAGFERVGDDLLKRIRRKQKLPRVGGQSGKAAPIHEMRKLRGLASCDLVIEAAPEDLELKRKLFADLAELRESGEAIFATNTSSLPVTEIAAAVPRPERVVGMHFFNPPSRMKLVEVVAGERSAPETVEAVAEVARQMGRTPILARDSPGFVANRLARPFTLEPLRMFAEGVADAPTIDRVVRLGGGFRMGPFELIDLIGLDVNLGVARSLYRQGGKPERWRPSEIQAALVEEGRLGRKSGRGFYAYGGGAGALPSRSAVPSPPHVRERHSGAVELTLDPEELARIDPAAPEILPRLIAQIANEAAFAREEQIASPEDMDTAMRLGFNWPRGPLELTAAIGTARAVALLEELRERHGEAYAPAPLLAREATD
jgi:3-hydroxybutyryl-CoA dehydrogenase